MIWHLGPMLLAPITTKTIIAVSTPILSLPDRRLRVAEWDMRGDQPPSVQRRWLCCRRRRCPLTSHQILIGQLGNSRLVFTLGAPDRVAPPAADSSPSNRARQKARQPASPRPRTREVSNPVPSSGESTNYLFLSRRRPFNTSGGAWADGTAGPRDVVEVSADVREEPARRMHRRTAKPWLAISPRGGGWCSSSRRTWCARRCKLWRAPGSRFRRRSACPTRERVPSGRTR